MQAAGWLKVRQSRAPAMEKAVGRFRALGGAIFTTGLEAVYRSNL